VGKPGRQGVIEVGDLTGCDRVGREQELDRLASRGEHHHRRRPPVVECDLASKSGTIQA
jgi:hypothetical protein